MVQGAQPPAKKTLAYLVSDTDIPFWSIMERGVKNAAAELGYGVTVFNAGNDAKTELASAVKAIEAKVDGLIVSPTNSSACATILKLAAQAAIPAVIADIGTDGGEYVAYIASDNRDGAYRLGRLLADTMVKKGWHDGRVGIIAIPQKRLNGQLRTAGFMQALNEAGIKGAAIRQQVSFSYQETYDYSRELIREFPGLKALWLQGSDKYQGALDAIRDSGKTGDILLITFDAEPEFLELIPKGVLVGAGMQQPFLMGEQAVAAMHRHLKGERVEKNIQLPVLAVSQDNIRELLPLIRRNVLGITRP
jgi:ABC-type sugar transport system substrate-binding protein